MDYAVRDSEGRLTGAVYPSLTDQIRAHHAAFGEDLIPVVSIDLQSDGSWSAVEPTEAEVAAGLEVSRFQARAALLKIGKLAVVEQVVAESEDPVVQMAWAEAVTWRRASPTIAALAAHPQIGLSPDDLDELFIAAAAIVL